MDTSTTTLLPARGARLLRNVLATPWLRPLNDSAAIDDLVGLLQPTFSLTKIRARVVGARRETPSARTLVLEPNRLWPGHTAGQHVLVEVEIGGRRVRRTFSLSSAPRGDGTIEITVKRREGGHVSAWWNDTARTGDVVTLSAPGGDFVLPAVLPSRVVLLSAGSGITPVMAMLRSLDRSGSATQVNFVHVARSRADAIFVDELEAMAARRPWLRLSLRFTSDAGRLDDAAWTALARDSQGVPAYVCGPVTFMEAGLGAWRAAGHASQLRMEHFGLATPAQANAAGAEVTTTRTRSRFTAAPGQSLLEAAEAAGLRPQHGCRMGVCHTCVCRKLTGTTVDLRDGRVSSEPGELIQLCVSAPQTPVTLDL